MVAKRVEAVGIEPTTFSMQSRRSSTDLYPPPLAYEDSALTMLEIPNNIKVLLQLQAIFDLEVVTVQ
jgi:hypothetical protein